MVRRGVLVTGSAGGVGLAIAEAFAHNGDRVAIHDQPSRNGLDAIARGLPGKGHVAVVADLTDSEAVSRMVAEAADSLGRLDVLVNNAGIFVHHPEATTSYEDWCAAWEKTLSTNLIGAVNTTYCALRHMREAGGRVVFISSRGAFRGEPLAPAYAASKAATNAFAQSMALAVAKFGIAVSVVAPGFVDSPMATDLLSGPEGAAIRDQSPFRRVARPSEVAAAVLFLASAEAEFTSGTILDVNGASYLRS